MAGVCSVTLSLWLRKSGAPAYDAHNNGLHPRHLTGLKECWVAYEITSHAKRILAPE